MSENYTPSVNAVLQYIAIPTMLAVHYQDQIFSLSNRLEAQPNKIYRCNECGNWVESVRPLISDSTFMLHPASKRKYNVLVKGTPKSSFVYVIWIQNMVD